MKKIKWIINRDIPKRKLIILQKTKSDWRRKEAQKL
jgi:hypothetical protein